MNSMLEGTTVGIALLGRVPVKLLEKLLKGIESLQVILLVTANQNRMFTNIHINMLLGRAVEDKTSADAGTVEVIVGVK